MVKVLNFGGVNEGAMRKNFYKGKGGAKHMSSFSVVVNGQVRTFLTNAVVPKFVQDKIKAYQEGKRKVAV